MSGAATVGARRPDRRRWLALALLALTLGLGGCLARQPVATPAPTAVVATVPSSFFAATPALAPPPAPPTGRFTLGPASVLPAGDPRAAYATPLLGPGTKALQLAVRVEALTEPRPPDVAYELVTSLGVFAALADGEWERASGNPGSYREDGTLLFAVPRDLHAARLEVVEYYYPQLDPSVGILPTPVTAPLVRRVLASFALDKLP